MKKVDFDKYAEDYDEILGDQLNFFNRDNEYFARYKVECIKEHVKGTPRTILEYGCGTGRNLGFLKGAFREARIYGCDISPKSLAIAREQNKDIHLFLPDQQPPESAFDIIFVAGVFHHVAPEERAGVMKNIAGLLKKGGELFIFEHNPWNPVTRRLVRDCPFDEDAVLIKPSELSCLLMDTGLIVEKKRYALFFPEALKYFRKYEKWLGLIPLGGQYFIHARFPAKASP